MNKIFAIFMLTLLAVFTLNCGQAPPQPNAFRLKTRVNFKLFGIIPLFTIPAPFQQINLKTGTAPGAPNTTGTKSEFDLNGAFVTTDKVGKRDAVDAVIPANWTVKVNPNQPIEYPCMYPATMSFLAQSAQTYKYKCSINIVNNFTASPRYIYVNANGTPSTGNNPINWGIKTHPINGEPVFANAQNLTVLYYRLTGFDTTNGDNEPIFQLESTDTPTTLSPDGSEVGTDYPDGWHSRSGYLQGNTTKIYHVVFLEGGVYIGHAEFNIGYPDQDCTRTRVCS